MVFNSKEFAAFLILGFIAFSTATLLARQQTGRIYSEGPTPCEKLLPPARALLDSAVRLCDDYKPAQSIEVLNKMLFEMKKERGLNGLCRARLQQLLAINYEALDSSETAEKYAIRSLEEDQEIWREYQEPRLTQRLRRVYGDYSQESLAHFIKRRKSFRFGAGTIMRADFSYRFYRHLDVVAGIGTPIVVFVQNDLNERGAKFFNQLLFYVRIQRMRKNLERLTAAWYLEFSLVENLKESGVRFAKVFSGGPIMSYTWQSGWEFGGSSEVARLIIGQTPELRFSQTAFKGKLTLPYANFEIYLRKWF